MAGIFFDSERREIRGDGFSIRHVAQRPNPPYYDIFRYVSGNLCFYFIAERLVSRSGDETDPVLVDTEIYDVKEIGYYYGDEQHYKLDRDISDVERDRVLSIIEKALWFDRSAFYKTPPKEIRISVRR